MYRDLPSFATPLDAALEYASRGWLVFPARSGGRAGSFSNHKINGAPWGATIDVPLIRDYWQQWPHADVAMATGAGSGVFALDVESVAGHGVDGLTAVQNLEREFKARLPRTATAKSRSDGRHLYFRHPGCGAKVKLGNIDSAPGVEVKGDGGSITLPPTPGYTWLEYGDAANPPGWLLELVLSEPPRRNSKPSDDLIEDMPVEQIVAALDVIPNQDLPWDTWNKIGMAIWRSTAGSDEGLAAFIGWSAKSMKFSEREARQRWQRFHRSPPTKIGRGTIEWLAHQADPDWWDTWFNAKTDLTFRGRKSI